MLTPSSNRNEPTVLRSCCVRWRRQSGWPRSTSANSDRAARPSILDDAPSRCELIEHDVVFSLDKRARSETIEVYASSSQAFAESGSIGLVTWLRRITGRNTDANTWAAARRVQCRLRPCRRTRARLLACLRCCSVRPHRTGTRAFSSRPNEAEAPVKEVAMPITMTPQLELGIGHADGGQVPRASSLLGWVRVGGSGLDGLHGDRGL
jgi:hypothetical protein